MTSDHKSVGSTPTGGFCILTVFNKQGEMIMAKILKFELKALDIQTITMPVAAEILDVQYQQGKLCVWVLAGKQGWSAEGRTFRVAADEVEIPDNPGTYVATVQTSDERYTHHLFEM